MSFFSLIAGKKLVLGTSLVAALATLVIGNDDAGKKTASEQPARVKTAGTNSKSVARQPKIKTNAETIADAKDNPSTGESMLKPGADQNATSNSSDASQTLKAGSKAESLSMAAQLASERLRLPKYFSGLVDDQQRQKIHKIQLEYRERLTELETELSQLKNDELQAVEAVLTESQRKLLSQKRQAALNKSSAKPKGEPSNG